jgi:sugar/nucleoside kinase (ribokinase family)
MRRLVKPILCVGDAHPDIIFNYNKNDDTNYLLDGESISKAEKARIKMVAGGTVGNVAIALSRLGEKTSFVGKVGRDILGDFILKYFENEGIETEWILKDEENSTEILFCFIDQKGDYDFYAYPEISHVFDNLRIPDIPKNIIQQFGLLFTSGTCLLGKEFGASIISVFRKCKEMKIPIAFDLNFRLKNYGGNQDLKSLYIEAVKYADILFGSEKEEIAAFMETDDVNQAISDLVGQNKTVIGKSGERGAAVYTRKKSFKMPAFPVKVVDTVGAGDVFNGGFLAAYAKGKPLRDCLLWGCAAAGYSVQFIGSENAPNEQQLSQFIEMNSKTAEEIKEVCI